MTLETTYASRNIGDIFFTLRKDATLNGAVEADGSEYNAFEFNLTDELSNPYTLCINDRLPAVDYATYALEIKQHGCCAFFGIDPTNGRFRVPTLHNVHIKAGDIESLAQYLAPHVPNIKGITPIGYGTGNSGSTGPFYDTDVSCNNMEIATVNRSKAIGFDASRMSSVYQDEVSDVEVASLTLRPMVQLIAIGSSSSGSSSSTGGSGGGGGIVSGFPLPYTYVPGTEARALEVNANFDRVRSYLTSISEELEPKQDRESKDLITTSKEIVGAINEVKTDVLTKAENSTVVHKTGAETITGLKTISGTSLNINDSNVGLKVLAPKATTGNSVAPMVAYANNAAGIFSIWAYDAKEASNQNSASLNANGNNCVIAPYKPGTNSTIVAITASVDANGKAHAFVPTVDSLTDNSLRAVNTSYLKRFWDSKSTTLNSLAYLAFPNYASGVAIGSGYKATVPGWVKWRCNQENTAQLWINGVEVGVRTHYKYGSSLAQLFPVSQGDVITFSNTMSATFFRSK